MAKKEIIIDYVLHWWNDEIKLIDKEGYSYSITEVEEFQNAFMDKHPFDIKEIDFINHVGWGEYDEEFDLIHDLNHFIDCHIDEFFKYAIIDNLDLKS